VDTPQPDPPGAGGSGAKLPAERVARNEATARSVNEAIESGRVSRDELSPFVCECGQLGCNAVVEMPMAEYEAVRAHPRNFVLVPGHKAPADEVVTDGGDYQVVAKQGVAGRIAEETDPRSP
jgi:hypothetical protein